MKDHHRHHNKHAESFYHNAQTQSIFKMHDKQKIKDLFEYILRRYDYCACIFTYPYSNRSFHNHRDQSTGTGHSPHVFTSRQIERQSELNLLQLTQKC